MVFAQRMPSGKHSIALNPDMLPPGSNDMSFLIKDIDLETANVHLMSIFFMFLWIKVSAE